jgi:hypothetical protein
MSNKFKNIKKNYNTTQDELEGESASRGYKKEYKKEKARKLSKMNLRSKHIDDLLDLMEDNNY